MGRKKARKLTIDLERKIEKYYQAQQKLKQKKMPILEINLTLSPQWEDICNHMKSMGIDVFVFISGNYYFLGEPVTTLAQLIEDKIENYELFIAELEDYINHYDEIIENYQPYIQEVENNQCLI